MIAMAEEEENGVSIELEFPKSRVKKIMTLDKDVKRVSSEALFLVSRSTELFLQFLAEKSAKVAIEKKRKTVNLEHVRMAVKRHQPTRDFLLDDLPPPSEPSKPDGPAKPVVRPKLDAAPSGTRRIDQFFRKPEPQNPTQAQSPENPAQAQSSEIPAQAQAPEIPSQTESPEVPSETQSPEVPSETQSPEAPSQTRLPFPVHES
ncbi:dr1-associated corepressor [Vigna umbellata]|uniref:dr1-associated corepressor n=1 Tax=Vigna umbellata TaxID=87088 RepID=UPI001F5E4E77|nr:dr1-associated corepressor [Vigna umbellata]